jgi:glycosyltransferase involved in cell wall biosynthesis
MKKEIDVVIPAYNAGYTIDKTLMSIAIQNIADKVCVIIVDDCSDKEHRELYRKYIDNYSKYFRIEYVKLKENSGPGVARREGLNFGDSEFVTFIDADDIFATSTALFTLYTEIKNNEKLYLCNSIFQEEVHDQDNNFHSFNDHDNDMTWMFGKIYRRSFLKALNINFNYSRSNEDCGFNTLCMLLCTSDNLKYIPRLTYCWNYNELSITKNNDYSFWGLKGYIYNNIWAVLNAQRILDENKAKPAEEKNPYINEEITQSNIIYHTVNVMGLVYMYYETLFKNNRPNNQIELYRSWALDYYRDIYIQYRNQISSDIFISSYKRVRTNHDSLLDNYVERISFIEFIDALDNYFMESRKVQRITNETGDILGYIKKDDLTFDENGSVTNTQEDLQDKMISVSNFNLFTIEDSRYDYLLKHTDKIDFII